MQAPAYQDALTNEAMSMTTRTRTKTIIFVFATIAVVAVGICMYYVIATPGKAIVTIHSISQGEHGGLRIEQEYEVIGPNMALRMGRKIDNEIFIYNEDTTGSVLEGIFNRYALKNSGTSQGSIEMGECPPDQMLKTPIRIELKRGDRIVIATCIFKDGRKSELFFSCN